MIAGNFKGGIAMNVTATWNGTHWSFSPTQRPGGNRIVIVGSQTVQITLATQGTSDQVALPAGTSNLVKWPQGTPSWFQSNSLSRLSDTSFSFLDPDPPSSNNQQYELRLGYMLNGRGPLWTPDPIIINKDPDPPGPGAASLPD